MSVLYLKPNVASACLGFGELSGSWPGPAFPLCKFKLFASTIITHTTLLPEERCFFFFFFLGELLLINLMTAMSEILPPITLIFPYSSLNITLI